MQHEGFWFVIALHKSKTLDILQPISIKESDNIVWPFGERANIDRPKKFTPSPNIFTCHYQSSNQAV